MGAPLVVVASTTKSSEGVAAASFLDADEESLDQVIALLHRDSEGVQIRRRHRATAANSAHSIKRRGQRGRQRHATARTEPLRLLTLATHCAALICSFGSQALSTKCHHWALRLMYYDMEPQQRFGTHEPPDAGSRLPGNSPRGATGDDSFTGAVTEDLHSHSSTHRHYRGR